MPLVFRDALTLISFSCLILGCASRENIVSYTIDIPKEKQFTQTVLAYQNQETSDPLPQWVKNYLLDGEGGIEKEREYADFYCFVAEETAPTLSSLMQWERNFNIEQDFSLLVFTRVYDRLMEDVDKNPVFIYGSFFEEVLTLTSSTLWERHERRESFWVKVKNEEAKEENYKLMILCVINKMSFTTQFTKLMGDINVNKKNYTRDQINAVNRVRFYFWNTF